MLENRRKILDTNKRRNQEKIKILHMKNIILLRVKQTIIIYFSIII